MLPMLRYEVSVRSSFGTRSMPRCSILNFPATRWILAYHESPYEKLSPWTTPSLISSEGASPNWGNFSRSRPLSADIAPSQSSRSPASPIAVQRKKDPKAQQSTKEGQKAKEECRSHLPFHLRSFFVPFSLCRGGDGGVIYGGTVIKNPSRPVRTPLGRGERHALGI